MPDPVQNDRSRPLAAIIILMLLALAATILVVPRSPPPRPAVLSDRTPRASQPRCAECHTDITDRFPFAPHARTLHKVDDEIHARFAGRSFHNEKSGAEFHYESHDGELRLSTPAYARELSIEWIFGSGTHAQTPLILLTGEDGRQQSIEHSVSWYPSGKLGVTLGQEEVDVPTGIHALGRLWGPAETINCFGCHSTFVPVDGQRIHFNALEPGIGCARCHWDTPKHLQEMDAGQTASIERLSALSPREAVDRCGECHRRAEEVGGPITPDDSTIVRFAPVGLVQSPCFQKQQEVLLESGRPARLVCTTCHDPHGPSQQDWQVHVRSCLTCHDAAHDRAPDCRVAARDANCLPCHMPHIPANENLSFTDHWIRIRRD